MTNFEKFKSLDLAAFARTRTVLDNEMGHYYNDDITVYYNDDEAGFEAAVKSEIV